MFSFSVPCEIIICKVSTIYLLPEKHCKDLLKPGVPSALQRYAVIYSRVVLMKINANIFFHCVFLTLKQKEVKYWFVMSHRVC